jgi:hypothetical protein
VVIMPRLAVLAQNFDGTLLLCQGKSKSANPPRTGLLSNAFDAVR